MEQIKIIIKTHFELLIMVLSVLFVIGVFFISTDDYGIGIFGTAGTIFAPLTSDDVLENEGAGHLQGVSDYIPLIQYNKGILYQGDCVEFKSLLDVILENDITVNGSGEDGFAIYLIDIQTRAGNSVLEMMSTEELANMEEIPSAFVYDKELDMLYIFGSGVFIVTTRIYSDAGGVQEYKFQIPVELP